MLEPLKVEKESIYINYNQNTNEKIRSKIFKIKKANFITLGTYGLDIKDYIYELKSNNFILSYR